MSTHVYSLNRKRKPRRQVSAVTQQQLAAAQLPGYEEGVTLDTQHLLVSALLPPSIKEFFAMCEREVAQICGSRHARGGGHDRWGTQRGSIILGGQRVALRKPRVRGPEGERELTAYADFQNPAPFDQQVFQDGLRHVSQRDYEKGLPKIAASFGFSKSAVSRSWVKASQKQLEKLQSRPLNDLGIVAVFIDGKRFKKLGVVIALGVSSSGHKHVLGIYQSSTEHSSACRALLDDLERRGLPRGGLLFVVDGGSGLNKALGDKYDLGADPARRRAVRVRCHIHKWRNLHDVLTDKQREEAAPLFWAIRESRDLTQAMECAAALERVLGKHNVSVLNSFLEAKDDLLALHRLGLSSELRQFFSSTNAIESLNGLLEEDLRRVKHWRDSAHFQRWLATACLHNERRMKRVKGYRALPALVVRLQSLCNTTATIDNNTHAA
jgi:transposase-like protein